MNVISSHPSLTILIIDDNKGFRMVAQQCITGHEKLTATNAAEGIALFKAHRPDITFLDIDLPDQSGLELLDQLLAIDPKSFIVMMTSSKLQRDVILARKKGALGYLAKPFNRSKVNAYIDEYFRFKHMLKELPSDLPIKAALKAYRPNLDTDPEPSPDQAHALTKNLQTHLSDWHILFVDHYAGNLTSAKPYFEALGLHIDIASTAEDALALIQQKPVHMVFLDTKLPDMSGYELTEKIREMHDSHPASLPLYIVGMAQDIDEVLQNHWQESGMDSYLCKPCSFATLKQINQQYMEYHLTLTEPNHH